MRHSFIEIVDNEEDDEDDDATIDNEVSSLTSYEETPDGPGQDEDDEDEDVCLHPRQLLPSWAESPGDNNDTASPVTVRSKRSSAASSAGRRKNYEEDRTPSSEMEERESR